MLIIRASAISLRNGGVIFMMLRRQINEADGLIAILYLDMSHLIYLAALSPRNACALHMMTINRNLAAHSQKCMTIADRHFLYGQSRPCHDDS